MHTYIHILHTHKHTHTHTYIHTHLYFTHYANFVYNEPFPRKSIRQFDLNLMYMDDIGTAMVAEYC